MTPQIETARALQRPSRRRHARTLTRNDQAMATTVHHPRAAASGNHPALLSGNTYATRPTRRDPVACDCCNRPIGYFESNRSTRAFAFGELSWILCRECNRSSAAAHPDGEPRELIFSWIVTRAGRFGQQYREAVQAQLGWQA